MQYISGARNDITILQDGTADAARCRAFDRSIPQNTPGRNRIISHNGSQRRFASGIFSRLRKIPLANPGAMYAASFPTPPTSDDVAADWKNSPTKNRPGWVVTTPRSWIGSP